MTDTTITWLGGVMELQPVKYWIESNQTGKWWWRKTEYYLHSELGSLGPFDSAGEIYMTAAQTGMKIDRS